MLAIIVWNQIPTLSPSAIDSIPRGGKLHIFRPEFPVQPTSLMPSLSEQWARRAVLRTAHCAQNGGQRKHKSDGCEVG